MKHMVLEVQYLLRHGLGCVVLWSWMPTGVVWLHSDGVNIISHLSETFLPAIEGNLQNLVLFVKGTPALRHLPDFALPYCDAREIWKKKKIPVPKFPDGRERLTSCYDVLHPVGITALHAPLF